ncbi:MAG: hypothetical protein LBU60_00980 [Clostridiales bacterium]|nr:hypothetical protein [Clostridiales bacterium]
MKVFKKIKILVVVVVIFCCADLFLAGCSVFKSKFEGTIKDYFGQYTFVLPFKFDYIVGYDKRFSTSLSLEQQKKEIENAGYTVEKFDNFEGPDLFIQASKNDAKYYFIIKERQQTADSHVFYEIGGLSIWDYRTVLNESGMATRMLFPEYKISQMIGINDEKNPIGFECIFEGSFFDFVTFYNNLSRQDFEIDFDNHTVSFNSTAIVLYSDEDKASSGLQFETKQVKVILQIMEDNYLKSNVKCVVELF